MMNILSITKSPPHHPKLNQKQLALKIIHAALNLKIAPSYVTLKIHQSLIAHDINAV